MKGLCNDLRLVNEGIRPDLSMIHLPGYGDKNHRPNSPTRNLFQVIGLDPTDFIHGNERDNSKTRSQKRSGAMCTELEVKKAHSEQLQVLREGMSLYKQGSEEAAELKAWEGAVHWAAASFLD